MMLMGTVFEDHSRDFNFRRGIFSTFPSGTKSGLAIRLYVTI